MLCCRCTYRRGGGPTPLLDNPSVRLCVLIAFFNVVLFVVSSAGVFMASLTHQVCEAAPLWYFMLVVGVESIVCGSFFLQLAFLERASDRMWARKASMAFVVNALQIVTMLWGMASVYKALFNDQCKEGATDVVRFAFSCTIIFMVLVGLTFCSVKFVFIPSLTMQLRDLRHFK